MKSAINLKATIKMIVSHFFVICVAVMFFTSILYLSLGYKLLPIYYPFQILLTGLITSLPSALFYFRSEPSKKQYYLRFFIHFCLIEAIVMTEGGLMGWYGDISEAIVVFVIVILVYAAVVLYSRLEDAHTAKNINDALDKFHKENDGGQ